jgi:phosphoribosyl-ATP pyrophosphohydrolase/phosphoribosyl-AMP cyclohydrolase
MIIPSIDLSQAKAVQLKQGRKKVLETSDVLGKASEFAKFGEIAVVDLDSALGKGQNNDLICKICRFTECRVGGGIRSLERAREILSLGAEKIIISTKAFEGNKVNHEFLKSLNSMISRDRIIIALDSFDGKIVTHGWKSHTGLRFESVLGEIKPYASELLFTSVEKEGLMQGADLKAVKKLRKNTDLRITVAGGISTLEEIQTLSRLEVNVQMGMALYTEKISLPDAFIASLKWDKGLIPTITVDTSSQVLMLAYSSQESLKKTFDTGKVWYYSRSRKSLWMKGEASGNIQTFLKIRTDCDSDALLVTVSQKGVACHTGKYSCFGDRVFSLDELYHVIQKRLSYPSSFSYTSSLTKEKLKQKIEEEARELVEAEKKDEIIWEAADLIYFVTVMLAKNHISFKEIEDELKIRRRTPKKFLNEKMKKNEKN